LRRKSEVGKFQRRVADVYAMHRVLLLWLVFVEFFFVLKWSVRPPVRAF